MSYNRLDSDVLSAQKKKKERKSGDLQKSGELQKKKWSYKKKLKFAVRYHIQYYNVMVTTNITNLSSPYDVLCLP